MYTVIVADDEFELRNAIVEKIDWASIGFEVVGSAENGIEALELVERLEPDLLLTDIKMPFVSGIELARQVREIRPAANIAFLSGYDDFSYAQQAIQYNIISYMLKPMSMSEMTGELILIKSKMDQKRREFKTTSEEKESESDAFLMSLLLDNAGLDENDRFAEEKALEFKFKRTAEDSPAYVVIVTQLQDRDGNNLTVPGHKHSINMILSKYVRYGSFYSNGKIVSLIAEVRRELNRYLHIIVKEISQSIERLIHLNCLIGVSSEAESLSDCKTLYSEAVTAIRYSNDRSGRVHYITDMEHSSDLEYEYIKKSVSRLESLLKMGDTDDISEFLDKLFSEASTHLMHQPDINLLVIEIIAAVCGAVSAVSGSGISEEFFSKSPIKGNIFMYRSIDEVKKEIVDYCMLAKNTISGVHKQNSEIICDETLEIIDKEYGDETLSLGSISDRLHVSSNYLSAILKKNKGDTFTNFLTEKRMKVARDCLLCSSMKVLEITEKCGYSDQHYFSYCFKKYFGMSPNKMREAAKSNA